MRKAIFSFLLILASLFSVLHTAQAASPDAGRIFDTLGGTTTIDNGGVIHSQARTIYSLGGGQVSFKGKKVSLLAADPPSFSAGCAGISWHFGGFSFISMDEIRQLVEAIAQASLGVAVDIAMHVLCPQCYAVMAKLREISNMMRNAAADACKVARAIGMSFAKDFLGLPVPDKTQSSCSSAGSSTGAADNWLNAAAGALCRGMSSAEDFLAKQGKQLMDSLNGTAPAGAPTPDQTLLAETGNISYKALGALGYQDGLVKDIMLSVVGMTVVHPIPDVDCKAAFKNLVGSATPVGTLDDRVKIYTTNTPRTVKKETEDGTEVKPSDSTTAAAVGVPPSGSKKGSTICHAAPLIDNLQVISDMLLCGPNPQANMKRFADAYFDGSVERLTNTSIGVVCAGAVSRMLSAGPAISLLDIADPYLYTCREGTGECREPKMARASTLLDTNSRNGYDGLVWMVADALYRGAKNIINNKVLDTDTIAILSASDYPLYRLLNMAAVYPGLAGDLLGAYGSTIATQHAMDTLDRVAKIGAQPAIDMRIQAGVTFDSVNQVREQIMQTIKDGQQVKSQILTRLSEKRNLVESILQVNRSLQAEVVSKGISGNNDLAISLKKQAAAVSSVKTP